MIFGYERDCFDKNNIADIINKDFINQCVDSVVKTNYNFKENGLDILNNLNTSKNIDISNEKNFVEYDKKYVDLLLPRVKKILKHNSVSVSGFYLYPKTGYMGWHTNYLSPCWRLYITYATEDKKSFLKFQNPITKEIITDYDDVGITIRKFYVTGKPPYFWHCVGSMCDRFSFGFRIL